MKFSNQTNQILGKDWLCYHPYGNTTHVDNYYITLCNKVLKIIRQPGIAAFLNDTEKEKTLTCVLVAYFEDVISETRFIRLHKKMYGKELPFYEISDDYYGDEINLLDIYFLIWYHLSVCGTDFVFDPYFENDTAFIKAVTEIYDLFDSEFENAPQNENLQNFLQLPVNSDVKTIREKLSFIARKSFLWEAIFDVYIDEVLDKYKENGKIVLDEQTEVEFYDSQIRFIFDECLPLLTLRATEYYAEILGEEHPEYHFIKNIPKRILGSFLIRKIEENGFLIEHLTSKKQLWLSNEFTGFQDIKLVENETVLTICLVRWKDDVWQNQGGCIINTIHEMNGKDISEHLFDDENRKKEFLGKLEKSFLKLTNGERLVYMRGNRSFAEFYVKLVREHNKMTGSKITDKELDEKYQNFVEDSEKNKDFEKDEALCVFFNPNSGIEIFREGVTSCMSDKNNPYYAKQEFDINDLLTTNSLSKEFVYYAVENDIIKLCIIEYENPDMFNLVMENFDFLFRFFRRSNYFSKPTVTIK